MERRREVSGERLLHCADQLHRDACSGAGRNLRFAPAARAAARASRCPPEQQAQPPLTQRGQTPPSSQRTHTLSRSPSCPSCLPIK
jgi:hypothetical protein